MEGLHFSEINLFVAESGNCGRKVPEKKPGWPRYWGEKLGNTAKG